MTSSGTPQNQPRFPGGKWLPDMDLNHDKQIQSLLCYRYTIGQLCASKVEVLRAESRLVRVPTIQRFNAIHAAGV